MHEIHAKGGSFKDRHPWRIAQDLLAQAASQNTYIPILFAVEETQKFSDWALLEDIEVATFSGQRFETHCSFQELKPVNPIFEELDSVVLMPSKEQLHREHVEPIRHFRQHLDLRSVRPYAICQTPMFIFEHEAHPDSPSAVETRDQ